jgi:uncharacterized protein YdeI (BOF family)
MTISKYQQVGASACGQVGLMRQSEPATGRRTVLAPLWLVFGLMVCLLLPTACHKSSATILGKPPRGTPRTILSVRAGDTPPQVTISGVMIEKCPVAGCWFRLRDATGIIKVDTRLAGFVVVDIPLQSQVTVAGKVVAEGSDVLLAATGLRY